MTIPSHYYVFNDEQLEHALTRFVVEDTAFVSKAEAEGFKARVQRFLASPQAEKLRVRSLEIPAAAPVKVTDAPQS